MKLEGAPAEESLWDQLEPYREVLETPSEASPVGEAGEHHAELAAVTLYELKTELSRLRAEFFRLSNQLKTLRLPPAEAIGLEELRRELAETNKLLSQRLMGGEMKWRRQAVEELIIIVDAFDRLITSVGEERVEGSLWQGLMAIRDLLMGRLRAWGAEPLPLTDRFDPKTQRAVAREEHDDLPDQWVIRVLRPGYQFEGAVLRPTEVVVNRNPGQ